MGRLRLVSVMEHAKKGRHVEDEGVQYVQAREYTLTPVAEHGGEATVNVDGELVGFSPMRVRCVPSAIRVLLP